ncbi:hypothetical protein YTPLAS18_27950 [Nitrospira sp.]|nr:hypothetical protein YTPLAS18_27950 [Nitrospira sp.]
MVVLEFGQTARDRPFKNGEPFLSGDRREQGLHPIFFDRFDHDQRVEGSNQGPKVVHAGGEPAHPPMLARARHPVKEKPVPEQALDGGEHNHPVPRGSLPFFLTGEESCYVYVKERATMVDLIWFAISRCALSGP